MEFFRKEEAIVAARKTIRARLCQSTPMTVESAEIIADYAAKEAIDILLLNARLPTSVKQVQIMDCLEKILQFRHDTTKHEMMHDYSEENKPFFDNQKKLANNQLRQAIDRLSELLEIPGLLEGLTERNVI